MHMAISALNVHMAISAPHLIDVVLVHPPERQPGHEPAPTRVELLRHFIRRFRATHLRSVALSPPYVAIFGVRRHFAPIALGVPNLSESFAVRLVEARLIVSEPGERRSAVYIYR